METGAGPRLMNTRLSYSLLRLSEEMSEEGRREGEGGDLKVGKAGTENTDGLSRNSPYPTDAG